jgi:hypothetical protein
VWRTDGQRCRQCDKELTAGVDVHYDHIYPWVYGGGGDERNVQLLCETCNLRKGSTVPVGVALPTASGRTVVYLSEDRHTLADVECDLDLARRYLNAAEQRLGPETAWTNLIRARSVLSTAEQYLDKARLVFSRDAEFVATRTTLLKTAAEIREKAGMRWNSSGGRKSNA